MYKLSAIILFAGMVMSSCGNRSNENQDSVSLEESESLPTITENGVEPFFLGASLYSIAPSGVYYDTIVLEKYYCVAMGDHAVDVDEEGPYYE